MAAHERASSIGGNSFTRLKMMFVIDLCLHCLSLLMVFKHSTKAWHSCCFVQGNHLMVPSLHWSPVTLSFGGFIWCKLKWIVNKHDIYVVILDVFLTATPSCNEHTGCVKRITFVVRSWLFHSSLSWQFVLLYRKEDIIQYLSVCTTSGNRNATSSFLFMY